MRKAFILGCCGQDGSYLAELLLSKGYEVHGMIRRSSSFNTGRIDHIFDKLHLHHGDITDGGRVHQLIQQVKPDEVYSLAAQSHVAVSFTCPQYTTETIVNGTLNVLEACKDTSKDIRIYQASSSEMFGTSPPPQAEGTPFHPVSPYGAAKVAAHHLAVVYREAYGMHVRCGILFNHESPRRGPTFVTRKLTIGLCRVKKGKQAFVEIGNPFAVRDWGHAKDYVRAMWMMMQHPMDETFCIGTGRSMSVRDFAFAVCGRLELDFRESIKYNDRYKRPAEVPALQCSFDKARSVLNWKPEITTAQLIDEMVEEDLKNA